MRPPIMESAMAEQPVTVFTPPRQPASNPSPATVTRADAPVRSAAQVDGTQSSPASTPAQRLWSEQRQRADEMHGYVDPATHAIVRQPDGQLVVKPRADGGAPEPGQPSRPQPTEAGPATVGADGKLHVGDYALSPEDIRGLLERKSAEDSRAANTPATADGFTLDLPADFELPPGTDGWAWDLNSPHTAALLGRAKEFAFAHGLDQPAFSGMLGLYAASQIAEERKFNEAKAAEVGKLGSNAAGRVDAVNTFLESQVGSELAGELRRTMVTAGQVKAYERIMRNFIGQGVSGNPGASRDGASSQPQRMSDEEYSKLSYHERISYAKKFQAQSNGSRK
jgi:hypothetical protein